MNYFVPNENKNIDSMKYIRKYNMVLNSQLLWKGTYLPHLLLGSPTNPGAHVQNGFPVSNTTSHIVFVTLQTSRSQGSIREETRNKDISWKM